MKKFLQMGYVFILILVLAGFIGCDDSSSDGDDESPIAVTGVQLSSSAQTVSVNHTYQLTASVSPINATNKDVTWDSDYTDVATVDSDGLVTAVAEGTAVITVTTEDGDLQDTCTITAEFVGVTGMVGTGGLTRTIEVGETDQNNAHVTPDDASDPSVTWESDNTGVATVSSTGLITGISEGTAHVTITSVDNSSADLTFTYTVTASTSDSYTLTVYNRTEGMLQNVYIGTYSCGDMDVDESCSYTYSTKPASITISKESVSDIGYAYDSNVNHTPSSGDSGTVNLTLSTSYYALWVRNQDSDYPIEAIVFQSDSSTFIEGWWISPITNNGLYRFIGFMPVSYDYNILWSDDNNDDTLDTADGDVYWIMDITSFGTNAYGSRYHVFTALP